MLAGLYGPVWNLFAVAPRPHPACGKRPEDEFEEIMNRLSAAIATLAGRCPPIAVYSHPVIMTTIELPDDLVRQVIPM